MTPTPAAQTDNTSVETLAPAQPRVQANPASPCAHKTRESASATFFSITALALVACLAVIHGWRPAHVLAPTDARQLVAPWETPGQDYIANNEQLLDQTVQFVPWTQYTIDRFNRGQVPLWNPYSQLGAPFIGNGQSAPFYPTILLHWQLPPTWSWTLSAALRLFVAGLGLWLLAGIYGLRGVPRLLSAVSFQLCGFCVVWLNHPQMNVMPLLPWAVLVVEQLVRRITLWRIVGGSLVFGVQFLGGHPASSVHLLLACGLVLGVRFFWPVSVDRHAGALVNRVRWGVGAGVLGVVIAFGFALAAAQWLPLIEYANHSGAKIVRQDKLHSLNWFEFNPKYLIGLLFPYANGYAPDGIAPYEMRELTKLPNTNELSAGFVGTIPLLLAIYACFVRRREKLVWTLAGLGVLSAMIATRFPIIDHITRIIPVLNVAQNARMLVVAAMALAILAGLGLQSLTEKLRRGVDFRSTRIIMGNVAVGIGVIALLAVLVLKLAERPIVRIGTEKAQDRYKASPDHEHSIEHVRSLVGRVHTELMLTAGRVLIPVTLAGIAAMLLWYASRKKGGGLAAQPWPWFGLALIDLLAFAMPFNPGSPAQTYLPPPTPTIRKLQVDLGPYRFAATHRTLMPEMNLPYEIADVRGYDALAPHRYYQWWDHEGIGDLSPDMQGYLHKMTRFNHPAWNLVGMRYLVTAIGQPAPTGEQWKLHKSAEKPTDAVIYLNDRALPRARVVVGAVLVKDTKQALDQVSKMDFEPSQIVLIESLDSASAAAWEKHAAASIDNPRVSFLEPLDKNGKIARDAASPETIQLRVSGVTGGWLVLADSCMPGWTAVVALESDVRMRSGVPFDGTAREVPIFPAYGCMRAIPLPMPADMPKSSQPRRGGFERGPGGRGAGSSSGPVNYIVEFRYRPWSWRTGAMISGLSGSVLILLIGLGMLKTFGTSVWNRKSRCQAVVA